MTQDVDSYQLSPLAIQLNRENRESTERVGEEWPPLLTKKWLAIHFECYRGGTISRRFRTKVLTPEVLQRAGISEEMAYSRSTKTFNVQHSMILTKILRGFCFIALLLTATLDANAQHPKYQTKGVTASTRTVLESQDYTRDTFVFDTIPGQAMITDSIVRMVSTGPTGQYRFENVLSTIVVDAVMVKEYRFLVKGSDGSTDPFDFAQTFFFLTGGKIDPRRILIFKQDAK